MADVHGFIGTYTTERGANGKGIYAFSFNGGVIEEIHLAAEAISPSWLCINPSGGYLYAANEAQNFNGEAMGAVSAYAVQKDGALKFINQEKSGGTSPCHLAMDNTGSFLICANYSSGTLSVFPLLKDGRLDKSAKIITFAGKGPASPRQDGPHAHSFWFSADYTRGYACDLGTDSVMCYDFRVNGPEHLILHGAPYKSSPGAGPRHMALNPAGGSAWLLNELNSTIEVLTGFPFERTQTVSTLPEGFRGNSTAAAIRCSHDGNFVYASNRGHDSIAAFRVLDKKGTLELLEITDVGGASPRDFVIDPTGNFLLAANRVSDNVVVFEIDKKTGKIKMTREYPVPSPVCVIFR